MEIKKAKNSEAAWEMQDTKEEQPHCWIQWKATNVFMDFHCICGDGGNIQGEFAYHVKCLSCGRVYFCNGHIELIELEEEPNSSVLKGW